MVQDSIGTGAKTPHLHLLPVYPSRHINTRKVNGLLLPLTS